MNATTRESDIFGVPQTVDLVGPLADGRWWSVPALRRATGHGKSPVFGLLQRMQRWGWVEVADNPRGGNGGPSGVALWRSGPTPKGPHPDWPRGTPRRLYRVTAYGRRQADRARLWAALDLPLLFNEPGRRGWHSWRRGCVYRAMGLAVAAEARERRRQDRG